MYVNLLQTRAEGQKVIAVIRAEGGGVQIEGDIAPRLREVIEIARGKVKGDEAFLRALEREFSGAYLRAKFIKD